MMAAVKPYLVIAAIYRNEAPYLREWIEFHRLVGAERFFLYNNESTDDHMAVLRPYIDEGIVMWEDFPGFPPQLACYQHAVDTHREDARWMAFIDIDEFLFSPTGKPVPEILRDFEQYPGVAVNCVVFGTSGHQTPPPGLVLENYTRRLGLERKRTKVVKLIVNPARTKGVGSSAHYFRYFDGELAVDMQRRPLRETMTETPALDLLRINHYFTRSQEERNRKLAAPRVDNGEPKAWVKTQAGMEGVLRRDTKLNEEQDETILMYVPRLRAALGLEPAVAES
jgi:Glycosyltransferase family 92